MLTKDIVYYCSCFKKLRRDRKNGGAPHKPILLISLIQAFQQKIFLDERIPIVPELVGLFKSNWKLLVDTNHQCLFALPFYHMHTEPFWQLVPNAGCELWVQSKNSMRSFSNLTTAVRYALIDNELAILFQNKQNSQILIDFLLETYFQDKKQSYYSGTDNYLIDIENQIVNEPQEDYKKRLLQIQKTLNNEEFQEEIFVRSNVFKKEVPKIYNFTCCISGLRVDSISNVSMIDACHIIPFSESYNDTITNGIALCPNLHRAFDRGLISISDNYKVLMNTGFSEINETSYSLKQFEGKELLLPSNTRYRPSQESLRHHRDKFGF